MVERFNRTILNNLSLMVSKNQQDWDQKVPLFLLAYRSAVHETTGYSPSQMLFGRDLRLPCDLLFGRPPDTPSSPEEYVQNLQARFEDVHNLARERINLRTEKMKIRYDTKATGHQFKEGDKVWFYNPTRRKGLSPKLQSHWDGPYTILKIINDVVIRIRAAEISRNITARVIDRSVILERSTTFQKNPVGSELAKVAKLAANLVVKSDANLALPPRFRQVLIESPL
ncbi:retrovirus-related Pol polyprotein from transposon 412 [Trichonephila clavipes]|nr:retrovirus-related Pol polyprotein from transposon 412 [Trichonephila clavipes]